MDLTPIPSFRLDGKRALVTGGGGGIGFAAASALSQAGAHVTVADIVKDGADQTAAALRAHGGDAEALMLDVTDVEVVRAAIAKAEPFDILVNNAGTNRPAPMVDVKVEDFDFVFGLNVRGVFRRPVGGASSDSRRTARLDHQHFLDDGPRRDAYASGL